MCDIVFPLTKGGSTMDEKLYKKAEQAADAKIGFVIHALTYLVVNTGLVVLNLLTDSSYLWANWPMIGWGIGLLIHGLSAFVFSGNKMKSLRDRMIEKEVHKLSSGL